MCYVGTSNEGIPIQSHSSTQFLGVKNVGPSLLHGQFHLSLSLGEPFLLLLREFSDAVPARNPPDVILVLQVVRRQGVAAAVAAGGVPFAGPEAVRDGHTLVEDVAVAVEQGPFRRDFAQVRQDAPLQVIDGYVGGDELQARVGGLFATDPPGACLTGNKKAQQ